MNGALAAARQMWPTVSPIGQSISAPLSTEMTGAVGSD
jgi:hypothetical protein